MRRLFNRSRMATIVTAAALSLVASVTTASASASGDATAQTCWATGTPNIDSYNDWGYGKVQKATAPLRPGPYADCGTRETLYKDAPMTIYCHYNNKVGSTWFYVSAYPNWTRGWIYVGNITWDSAEECW